MRPRSRKSIDSALETPSGARSALMPQAMGAILRSACADRRSGCRSGVQYARLLKAQPPGRLHLGFLFDCETAASAALVADTLRGLPPLAHAAVGLGLTRLDSEIVQLTREAVGRLTAQSQTFHKWPALPRELQLHVLRGVDFAFEKQMALTRGRLRLVESHDFGTWGGVGSTAISNVCCRRCAPTRAACGCPGRVAAASTSCRCAQPAMPLASRQMRADVTEINLERRCLRVLSKPPDCPAFSWPLPPSIAVVDSPFLAPI